MRDRSPAAHLQGIAYARRGEMVEQLRPGDFGLTHQEDVWARAIQFGQMVGGYLPNEAWWNHAFLCTSDQGFIVEATRKGVWERHISEYTPRSYFIVRLNLTDDERSKVVEYAWEQIGQRYDWLTVAAAAVMIATRTKRALPWMFPNTWICSGYVATSLHVGGHIDFSRPDTRHILPADLAQKFDVVLPQPDL